MGAYLAAVVMAVALHIDKLWLAVSASQLLSAVINVLSEALVGPTFVAVVAYQNPLLCLIWLLSFAAVHQTAKRLRRTQV